MSEKYFEIYQVKSGPEYLAYRFEDTSDLDHRGLGVDISNYDLVWQGLLPVRFSFKNTYGQLNKIFDQFNLDRPEGYKGRSLSVSDVIVFKSDCEVHAYYVESIGFSKIENFLGSRPQHSLDSMRENALLATMDQDLCSDHDELAVGEIDRCEAR